MNMAVRQRKVIVFFASRLAPNGPHPTLCGTPSLRNRQMRASACTESATGSGIPISQPRRFSAHLQASDEKINLI